MWSDSEAMSSNPRTVCSAEPFRMLANVTATCSRPSGSAGLPAAKQELPESIAQAAGRSRGQYDRAMRRRAKPPPHPADPPTTTNRHTNAHLLSGTTTPLRGQSKKVVEAGTANSAFAKGGRCPTVRQPLSTWVPGLHPTDQPLVLCQPFLIALLGRPASTVNPIREISGLPSLPAAVTLTRAAESFQWG